MNIHDQTTTRRLMRRSELESKYHKNRTIDNKTKLRKTN